MPYARGGSKSVSAYGAPCSNPQHSTRPCGGAGLLKARASFYFRNAGGCLLLNKRKTRALFFIFRSRALWGAPREKLIVRVRVVLAAAALGRVRAGSLAPGVVVCGVISVCAYSLLCGGARGVPEPPLYFRRLRSAKIIHAAARRSGYPSRPARRSRW